MCTLVVAWRVFADAPVVVAANRDEALDRPSEPPSVIAEDPGIVAPRDVDAGGTWIGYNAHSVFVAITNRWSDADLAGERSRGVLVRDALGCETAEDAARFVERAVAIDEYEGFNLLAADANAAVLCEWDGGLRTTTLEPGVHVVTNVGAIGRLAPASRTDRAEQQVTNGRRVRAALQPEPGERYRDWRDRAADVLGDHDYGVCIHREDADFGTRSSSLVTIGADGRTDCRYADGPPCRTAFEPVEYCRSDRSY